MTTITAEVVKAEGKRARDGRRITPVARRSELVRGYRSSGLTMAQFAQREEIKTSTLANMRRFVQGNWDRLQRVYGHLLPKWQPAPPTRSSRE